MKSTFLLSAVLIMICCYTQLVAQQSTLVRKNKPNRHELFRHQHNGMNQKIISNHSELRNSNSNQPANISDLTEFQKLPYQDPNVSYYEATPIALSNGNIVMLWASYDTFNFSDDTLYCATSTDGGVTWGNKKIIAFSPFNTIYYLTGLQTKSGRIIAVWTDGSNGITKFISSDDNGESWDSVISLPASSNYTWYPSVSQSINNTIYLSYSKDISDYSNIVFRTSTDDGLTWDAEKTLSNNQVIQNMGSIISVSDSGLFAVYSRENNGNWGIVKRSSTDRGDSWSAETIIIDSLDNEDDSRVIRINNDTLYLVYWYWRFGLIYDFYYLISGDNGNTWSNPVQLTRYAGYDGYVSNLTVYNNQPFVAFVSDRWQQVYNTPNVWYGVIEETVDNNPPPAILFSGVYKSYFAPGKEETILASIGDESGIQSAQVNITVNGGVEYLMQLFDDGQHNDWGSGDGIYGVPIGPFSLGDHLDYNFSVTDIDNNTINVQGFAVDVVHHGNPVNPNKGFEETPVGIVSGSIAGWNLGLDASASAVFEVIDDTIREGNHALKIEVTDLGINPYDIQAVNSPFPVEAEAQYRYFIWAKADKGNVNVNFDVEDPSFIGWGGIEAHLTTQWQEFSFDFSTPSGVNAGRSANWFGLNSNSTNLPIKFYIDDLRIVKLDLSVGVEKDLAKIPTEFSLSQNYPNPFNPSTVISYQLAVGSHVSLKVFDVLGNEIATLVNEEKPAGIYNVDFNASNLSSGVYFYKIEAGKFVQTNKMILLR